MYTQKEGVQIKNKVRKAAKDNRKTLELEEYSGEKKGHSSKIVTEASDKPQVFTETGFTTLREQDCDEDRGTCVLVDRISDESQVLTNKAQIAANCAVRTAMATKNSIDAVENVVKCMRKITSSMNEVVESVEKLGKHTGNIERMASTVGDIAERTNFAAQNMVQKSMKKDDIGQNSASISKDMKQVVRLINEEANITSEYFLNIVADIEECVKTTNTAARRIEEGYRTANDARITMDRVMDLVEEVSGRIDGMFEIADEVNTSSTDMIHIVDKLVQEVTASSKQLEKMSDELNGHIERFQSYGHLADSIAVKASGMTNNGVHSPADREYSALQSRW